MALIVYDLALQMLEHIKPIIDRVRRHDRNLADHMQRSAQSSFLNIAEAQSAYGRNEIAKFKMVRRWIRILTLNLFWKPEPSIIDVHLKLPAHVIRREQIRWPQ